MLMWAVPITGRKRPVCHSVGRTPPLSHSAGYSAPVPLRFLEDKQDSKWLDGWFQMAKCLQTVKAVKNSCPHQWQRTKSDWCFHFNLSETKQGIDAQKYSETLNSRPDSTWWLLSRFTTVYTEFNKQHRPWQKALCEAKKSPWCIVGNLLMWNLSSEAPRRSTTAQSDSDAKRLYRS